MSWVDKLPLPRFLNWLRGVLSEPDGSPSSTRVLLFAFSIFSMWLITKCFNHIFQLQDLTQLGIWLANMPMLITTLMGLISLPYAINKSSSTFSDIAASIANANKQVTPPQVVPTPMVQVPPAPVTPSPATGTHGIVKG